MIIPVSYTEGANDFGNTLDTTVTIAPVSIVTGRIGPDDAGDMFRIKMPQEGRISLLLDGLSGNLDLALIDAAGTVLRRSSSHSTGYEFFTSPVKAGEWYVHVYPYAGESGYRLSVTTALWLREGTLGDDSMTGAFDRDTLYGLDGDDTLLGLSGNDSLFGGSGNDRLEGGSQEDRLFGGLGDDTLLGGNGNDTLYGGAGDDRLETGPGDGKPWQPESAWGGAGNDTVIGNGEVGDIGGGAGNDLIDLRGPGLFRAWGGDGDDTLYASDGPAGSAYYNYWGGRGHDQLWGGVQGDWLFGGAGNDTQTGQDGNDTLEDGVGNDVLEGGAGNDVLRGGAGFDRLAGGAGADRFEFDRNQNWNRIEDFSIAEGDVLVLNQMMWHAPYGLLSPQDVVEIFGRIGIAGDVVLGFGSIGTQVRLVGVTTLDGLEDGLLLT